MSNQHERDMQAMDFNADRESGAAAKDFLAGLSPSEKVRVAADLKRKHLVDSLAYMTPAKLIALGEFDADVAKAFVTNRGYRRLSLDRVAILSLTQSQKLIPDELAAIAIKSSLPRGAEFDISTLGSKEAKRNLLKQIQVGERKDLELKSGLDKVGAAIWDAAKTALRSAGLYAPWHDAVEDRAEKMSALMVLHAVTQLKETGELPGYDLLVKHKDLLGEPHFLARMLEDELLKETNNPASEWETSGVAPQEFKALELFAEKMKSQIGEKSPDQIIAMTENLLLQTDFEEAVERQTAK